jgi:hypothetical protein
MLTELRAAAFDVRRLQSFGLIRRSCPHAAYGQLRGEWSAAKQKGIKLTALAPTPPPQKRNAAPILGGRCERGCAFTAPGRDAPMPRMGFDFLWLN